MHWEGIEPSTTGFVDRSSYPIELPVLMLRPMRRGVLDSPASRLSGGCSASELTAQASLISNLKFQISNTGSYRRKPRLGQRGIEPRTFRSFRANFFPVL
jgi:hypothetical protein